MKTEESPQERFNKNKLFTISGFFLGIFFILFGVIWPAEYSSLYLILLRYFSEDSLLVLLSRFVDLKSVFIVLGGTYASTMIAFPYQRAMRSFRYIAKALQPYDDQENINDIFQDAERLAKMQNSPGGIGGAGINQIKHSLMKRWVSRLIQHGDVSEIMINEIIESEIDMFEKRANEEIEVLNFMGATAPAFGMMGTIIGLVLIFTSKDDLSVVMQGMSVALLTTLYGVVLTNLIFEPVATKRKELKASISTQLEMIREAIIHIKRKEPVHTMLEDLEIYRPYDDRDFVYRNILT
ncbi:MotA/TolQ/ExbB proton channel family protein [Deltaproteobacteria bacterium TL4]